MARDVAAPGFDGSNKKGGSPKKGQGGTQTQQCRFFKQGKCNKGKDCPFAHGRAGSPAPNKDKNQNQKGKGSAAPASSSGRSRASSNTSGTSQFSEAELAKRKKTPRVHLAKGKCTFGDRCHYSHATPAAPAQPGGEGGNDKPNKKKKKRLRFTQR